ncbi:YeeE/YedE family protein [Stenotrophomonas maltophilia]|uniref:YeeE/YedE family protein n=1 Tax=Stenotrophomonas TaxID=40323 RepID=UPI0018D467DF|nr:YeeE/YedE family protein [Stenotrophomonas maltophilia]MBH1816830.1 YeeE/YedE family protein [Stenotrophomonas maltophilia]MCU1029709.1 YeeE/YedE family protein [Stenotrophomonas maltophilia]
MRHFPALIAGLLFGSGLFLSGMADPRRVLGFLDIAGAWDPSLAVVMAGALIPSALAYRWVRERSMTVTGRKLHLPDRSQIDAPLVIGACLFGVGWGLVGLCPGPAIALLATGTAKVFVFAGAMFAGMVLHHRCHR